MIGPTDVVLGSGDGGGRNLNGPEKECGSTDRSNKRSDLADGVRSRHTETRSARGRGSEEKEWTVYFYACLT